MFGSVDVHVVTYHATPEIAVHGLHCTEAFQLLPLHPTPWAELGTDTRPQHVTPFLAVQGVLYCRSCPSAAASNMDRCHVHAVNDGVLSCRNNLVLCCHDCMHIFSRAGTSKLCGSCHPGNCALPALRARLVRPLWTVALLHCDMRLCCCWFAGNRAFIASPLNLKLLTDSRPSANASRAALINRIRYHVVPGLHPIPEGFKNASWQDTLFAGKQLQVMYQS